MMRIGVGVLLLLATRVALAEAVIGGDRENGALLFHVQCAACHGSEARGGGPLADKLPVSVGNLRDPGFLSAWSDEAIRTAMLKGIQHKKQDQVMPASPWLTTLELADVISFLREGSLRVSDFFPAARYFTSKTYDLDQNARERIQKSTGKAVGKADQSLTVVTIYGEGYADGPEVVPQDPVQLDKLEVKQGRGYVVFAGLPRGKVDLTTGIALARNGQITRIASKDGLADRAVDKAYQGFVGQGKKGPFVALKVKGKGAPSAVEEVAFNQAYARALEAIGLADRDERDRHWADQK